MIRWSSWAYRIHLHFIEAPAEDSWFIAWALRVAADDIQSRNRRKTAIRPQP
jgi:hypothetical protein